MWLRFVFPLLNLVVAVLLFHVGDMQVRRVASASQVLEEPINDGVAKARYVEYALNAPAWALLGDTRAGIWSPSSYWSGYNLRFFALASAIWFLLGVAFEKRDAVKNSVLAGKRTLWTLAFSCTCIFWGVLTCHAILPEKPTLMSFPNYALAVASNATDWWWWYLFGLAWGMALILSGLSFLFRRRQSGEIAVRH
jgi:hypothetical protein